MAGEPLARPFRLPSRQGLNPILVKELRSLGLNVELMQESI